MPLPRKTLKRAVGRPAVIHATATIIARVPPALAKAIDSVAKAEGVTRAAMLRQLVEAGLAARGVKLGKA